MIIQNMGGYQRTENGAYATATQVYLALFTGNVGHTGDGVYDVGGVSSLTEVGSAYESNPDAQKYPSIPFSQFGEMVLADQPTKINFMWIANGNIASQWPNSNMVKKALEHIPFVVKVDHFMNATGLWADLVLPCTALFETPNVTASSRSAVLEISEAGVTPPGEAKTDLEITLEVAKRFGWAVCFNEDPEVYIKRVLEPTGVTYDELVEKKGVNMWERNEGWIAYKDGQFFTSTGKAHLWVQKWVDEGFPPIACHQRPAEHPLNAEGLAAKYPLAAVQRKLRTSVHTIFKNLDTMLDLDGHEPHVYLHPADAEARGIKHGDAVAAYNDRGEHAGTAFVTDHVKQGVVVLENGWDDAVNENRVVQSRDQQRLSGPRNHALLQLHAGRSQEGGITMTLGFHVATDHCYGCKTCTVACANEHLLNPGVLLRRVRQIDVSEPGGARLRLDGLQPLRRPGVRRQLPGGRLHQAGGHGPGHPGPQPVHRLQDLHRGVPVPCARLQRGHLHHLQVRRLHRPPRGGAASRVHRGVPEREHLPGRVRNGAFRACRRRFGQGRLGDASEPGGDARPRHHGGGVRRHRRHGRNGRPRRGGLLADRPFDPLRRRRRSAAPPQRALPARRALCETSRASEGERGGPCCILPGATSRGGWGSPQ